MTDRPDSGIPKDFRIPKQVLFREVHLNVGPYGVIN